MLTKETRISELQVLLDQRFGKGAWLDWEPETILLEFQTDDYLVMEKIFVLQALNKALNSVLSLPEFLNWTTSVCNNEPAEFETLSIHTCLELAWMIEEVKRVGMITGQAFTPSPEIIDILAYLLRLEGFSKPVYPFEFIPEARFEPGQTLEDTKMKEQAIRAYIRHMQGDHV